MTSSRFGVLRDFELGDLVLEAINEMGVELARGREAWIQRPGLTRGVGSETGVAGGAPDFSRVAR